MRQQGHSFIYLIEAYFQIVRTASSYATYRSKISEEVLNPDFSRGRIKHQAKLISPRTFYDLRSYIISKFPSTLMNSSNVTALELSKVQGEGNPSSL